MRRLCGVCALISAAVYSYADSGTFTATITVPEWLNPAGSVAVSGGVSVTGSSASGFYIELWASSDSYNYVSVKITKPSGVSDMATLTGTTHRELPQGTSMESGSYTISLRDYGSPNEWHSAGHFAWDGSKVTYTAEPQALPQRKLSWPISNSSPLPATAANLQTWAVFQFQDGEPTGIAFASRTLEAGETATLEIYVAENDTFTYAVGRVDYPASIAAFGSYPSRSSAYGLNPDGTLNYGNFLYSYLDGVLPTSGTWGPMGSYGTATPVTSIPPGTTGPGVNNAPPLIPPPARSASGPVTVTPGTGGTTNSTDSGTAQAVQQAANGIITAVNNSSTSVRQSVERAAAATTAGSAAIVQALNGFQAGGIIAAIQEGNTANAQARQAEKNARDGIEAETSYSAAGAAVAQRDAQLAGKDSEASALFSSINGGLTPAKLTPTLATGDASSWEINLGSLGTSELKIDINPFTNSWVQQKLPFLNWLVAFFRVAVVWSAQVTFYRWLMNTVRESAIAFMHTPSPPPTVVENIASSNPFTAVLGKVGAIFSSLFLAVLILSSLSTIISVVTTWGTVASLVDSIANGTNFMSSAVTGLGAATGYLGRMVFLVTAYIPVSALLGISANYVLIETGLVATMPVLVFSMRIRRW